MTGERLALPDDLAAAYIRELSVGVRAVLPKPPDLVDGVLVLPEGIVMVAGSVVVLMEPGALWSPTALDVAAATGVAPPVLLENPPPEAVSAARKLLQEG